MSPNLLALAMANLGPLKKRRGSPDREERNLKYQEEKAERRLRIAKLNAEASALERKAQGDELGSNSLSIEIGKKQS